MSPRRILVSCAALAAIVTIVLFLPRIGCRAAQVAKPRAHGTLQSSSDQMSPPPVQVKVTKVLLGQGRVGYRYTVVNGSAFPITSLSIGNDKYSDETELEVAPLGWNGDSIPQTPQSSVQSPPNWSFEFVPTEGGEPGTADWNASPSEAVVGGATVAGFAVTLGQENAPYEQGHWTVYLNTSDEILYTGALQPTSVSSVPVSSVFADSDLRLTPNPSKGPIAIQYTIPAPAVTSIDIYDAQGRLVRRLQKQQVQAGTSSTSWDGRDTEGRLVAAGVYFVRVKAPGTLRFGRVTLLR